MRLWQCAGRSRQNDEKQLNTNHKTTKTEPKDESGNKPPYRSLCLCLCFVFVSLFIWCVSMFLNAVAEPQSPAHSDFPNPLSLFVIVPPPVISHLCFCLFSPLSPLLSVIFNRSDHTIFYYVSSSLYLSPHLISSHLI
jgi:hypothetical protein